MSYVSTFPVCVPDAFQTIFDLRAQLLDFRLEAADPCGVVSDGHRRRQHTR